MNFRSNRRRTITAVVAGAVIAGPIAGLAFAGTANAASGSGVWDRIAQCESGGNWSTNTGNGFHGGLQFTESTWHANGGSGSPEGASKAEQIKVAQRVVQTQGWGAWPVCSKVAGASGSGATSSSSGTAQHTAHTTSGASRAQQRSTPQQQYTAPKTVKRATTPSATDGYNTAGAGGSYQVRPGDTLGSIAAAHGLNWQQLYRANASVIGGNPNLIMPGQQLSL